MSNNTSKGSKVDRSAEGQRRSNSRGPQPQRSRSDKQETAPVSENRATRNEMHKLDKQLKDAKKDCAKSAEILRNDDICTAKCVIADANCELQKLELYYQDKKRKLVAVRESGEKILRPGYDGWTKRPSEINDVLKLEKEAQNLKIDDVKTRGTVVNLTTILHKATGEARTYREEADISKHGNNYKDKKRSIAKLERRLEELSRI
ncbi:uncharacterized protein Bfra_011689 [Botrytis fragariae]|uniref:Uncharacterized protein n=1 Tax=Botrytis fragariae TaxID=1964551 RepID=A0A8H6EEF5_9HELO|nr:uncharacterized protein Bfra_011689 [Botrytis fragariae]KAF5869146.1 hypothetical protein Bfra_011689 [Botrytis fragariae]